ncbi:MAG: hypothetical protein HZB26_07150 [Candidatus Hydrogenedentes bacterium]|nr:hypothetical protein [Candidatus Hydrogenedentota bacterium]
MSTGPLTDTESALLSTIVSVMADHPESKSAGEVQSLLDDLVYLPLTSNVSLGFGETELGPFAIPKPISGWLSGSSVAKLKGEFSRLLPGLLKKGVSLGYLAREERISGRVYSATPAGTTWAESEQQP